MIDLHCHILPAIDDGPQAMEQSLAIAHSLVAAGYRQVLATPHAGDGCYNARREVINEKTAELNAALQEVGLPLTVHPGAEYPLVPELVEGDLATLNNSRYLLVELPFSQPIPQYDREVFFQLQARGLIPVLAHPERCQGLQEQPDLARSYVESGVLFQVNIPSFCGRYGKAARTLAEDLLQQGVVHFLATDSHRPLQYDLSPLKLRFGRGNWDKFTRANPALVLADTPGGIAPPQVEPPRSSVLSSFAAAFFRHR